MRYFLLKALPILVFGCLVSSCIDVEDDYIDPRLQGHYQEFLLQARLHGKSFADKQIVMSIEDLHQKNGNCSRRLKKAHIRIDRDFYEKHKNDHYMMECLVFHELGHGLLKRDHSFEYLDSTVMVHSVWLSDTLGIDSVETVVPKSIMSRLSSKYRFYEARRPKYLEELFR